MTVLTVLSQVMTRSLSVATLDVAAVSEANKSALMGLYNMYSGIVGSVVTMPFQQLLATVLPVLCVSVTMATNEKRSVLARYSLVLLSWLPSQAFNAMNVQFDSTTTHFINSLSDLVAADTASSFTFIASNITNTSTIDGIASTDTIVHPS